MAAGPALSTNVTALLANPVAVAAAVENIAALVAKVGAGGVVTLRGDGYRARPAFVGRAGPLRPFHPLGTQTRFEHLQDQIAAQGAQFTLHWHNATQNPWYSHVGADGVPRQGWFDDRLAQSGSMRTRSVFSPPPSGVCRGASAPGAPSSGLRYRMRTAADRAPAGHRVEVSPKKGVC